MSTPEPPKWLTDQEQGAWRGYLAVLRLVTTSMDRQLQDEAGLPHGYYQILAMLSEAPGRTLRMSQLESSSNSSLTLRDRRGHTASLTDSGFAALADLAPGHVAEVRRLIFDRLSPKQVAALKDLTDTITQPQKS